MVAPLPDRHAVENLLIQRLEPAAMRCPAAPFRDKEATVVKDFAVQQAATCPTMAGTPSEWAPMDVFKAFKTLAKLAAPLVGPDTAPRPAVSRYMSDLQKTQDPSWLAEFVFDDSDKFDRAVLASKAVSWLTRTREVLDLTAFRGWGVHDAVEWRYPDQGLILRANLDLTRPDGSPVMVIPSAQISQLDKAAYIFLVASLGRRHIADRYEVVVHNSGRVLQLDPTQVLERGIAAATAAADALTAFRDGEVELARTPLFFACRDCAAFDSCEPGQHHLATPAESSAGIRLR